MADGKNRYAYVGNSPVDRVDPSGEWHCSWRNPCILGCNIFYLNTGCVLFLVGIFAWQATSCLLCLACIYTGMIFFAWQCVQQCVSFVFILTSVRYLQEPAICVPGLGRICRWCYDPYSTSSNRRRG